MRNGYSPATIKTTAGPVTIQRPKLRGTTAAFASKLFGTTVTKSNALESLVIAGFVRGLPVRDVENTLADALGAEAALSKSTVSRVCQAIGEQFEAWRTRPLDGVVLDYLFLDASMFRMHPGARAEPVLAAWGTGTGGKPVFVALAAGGSESADAWGDFLDELSGRGLRPPLLVISDGAAGLISAAESVLARSLRQRCLIHRSRKDSTCRFRCVDAIRLFCDGAEERGGCGIPRRGSGDGASVLFQQGADPCGGVADGAAAYLEQVGCDLPAAHFAQVEDDRQDALGIGDLLGEDAAASSGQPVTAPALVFAAFGLGGLPQGEPLDQRPSGPACSSRSAPDRPAPPAGPAGLARFRWPGSPGARSRW